MRGRPPIRLLVTGFGPFPGMAHNPSAQLVDWILNSAHDPGPDVTLLTELIATEWEAVEKFTRQQLAELDPDIALHFGVHGRARGFRLEQRALNCAGTQADAAGCCYAESMLVKGSAHSLTSTFDAVRLENCLAARGIPAQVSRDAGRYLCNALLYQSLAASRKNSAGRMTGFVHIPRLEHLDTSTLRNGAKIIIDNCVAQFRAAKRAA